MAKKEEIKIKEKCDNIEKSGEKTGRKYNTQILSIFHLQKILDSPT